MSLFGIQLVAYKIYSLDKTNFYFSVINNVTCISKHIISCKIGLLPLSN